MSTSLTEIKKDFTQGLSQISRFWGFPKGMGAIFAVLYLSPTPLSLDELVQETGLTKGAISTEIRSLARMGLVHRSTKLGDRKDYYEAETDFYAAIKSILKERQNSEFHRDPFPGAHGTRPSFHQAWRPQRLLRSRNGFLCRDQVHIEGTAKQ